MTLGRAVWPAYSIWLICLYCLYTIGEVPVRTLRDCGHPEEEGDDEDGDGGGQLPPVAPVAQGEGEEDPQPWP